MDIKAIPNAFLRTAGLLSIGALLAVPLGAQFRDDFDGPGPGRRSGRRVRLGRASRGRDGPSWTSSRARAMPRSPSTRPGTGATSGGPSSSGDVSASLDLARLARPGLRAPRRGPHPDRPRPAPRQSPSQHPEDDRLPQPSHGVRPGRSRPLVHDQPDHPRLRGGAGRHGQRPDGPDGLGPRPLPRRRRLFQGGRRRGRPRPAPTWARPIPYHPPVADPASFATPRPCRRRPDGRSRRTRRQPRTIGRSRTAAGRRRVISAGGTRLALLRWDFGQFAGRKVAGPGLLELTTRALELSTDERPDFGLLRVVEILGGDPGLGRTDGLVDLDLARRPARARPRTRRRSSIGP